MRRNTAPKRKNIPDALLNDETVAMLIKYVMRNGKKLLAEKIVYEALLLLLLYEGETEKSGGEGERGAGAKIEKKHKTGKIPIKRAELATRLKENPKLCERVLSLLNDALEKIKPKVEVKSRRVGGSVYQVPIDVRPERRLTLALRWLIKSAKSRSDKSMSIRLAKELFDACNGRGGAFKKSEEVFKVAKANQAFAHFR